MIVVAPAANRRLRVDEVQIGETDAVICQLEIPAEVVSAAAAQAPFFCLNAAPARGRLEHEPDLLVVNRYEYDSVGRPDGLVAITRGAEGAVLLEDGAEIARARPPSVQAVDGTAAGDAFCAALVVSMLEGRERGAALARACAAGALAATPARCPAVASNRGGSRRGDVPVTGIILDCDPGHDDAIALLLALASPELELLGVTTVAGNHTLANTTANALRVLDHLARADIPVAAGAPGPLMRELTIADHVHGGSGLDGPQLPPPSRSPAGEHAVEAIARVLARSRSPVTLVATGPLTNVALFVDRYPDLCQKLERIVLMGGAIGLGNVTPAAEFNLWVDPEAAARVFTSGVPLTMTGLDVTHRALIGPPQIERLAQAGTAGRLVADLYDFYVRHHRQRYGWEGAPVHDAVAVAEVIDPSLLETAWCGVVIDTGGELSRGRSYVDLWGAAGWEPNCRVAVGIDAPRFLDLLVDRISALP